MSNPKTVKKLGVRRYKWILITPKNLLEIFIALIQQIDYQLK